MFLEDKQFEVDAGSSNLFLFSNLFLSYVHSLSGLTENTDFNKILTVSTTTCTHTHTHTPFPEKRVSNIIWEINGFSLLRAIYNSSFTMQNVILPSVIH